LQVIATGMVVLGCVSEVRDFELVISLPDGMYGTVGIANICGPYTSALERIANSEDDEDSVSKYYLQKFNDFKIVSKRLTRTGVKILRENSDL
jgi:hypothetical protein